MTMFSGESVVSSRGSMKFTHLSVEPHSPTAPILGLLENSVPESAHACFGL